MDIMKLLQPIGEKYKNNQFGECIEDLKQLWETIPAPKENIPNAYLVVEYLSRILLKLDKYDEAFMWGIKGTVFNSTRNQAGEAEFLLGEIAYQSGYHEFAKDMFLIAKKRSKGRIFKNENPEFLKLIDGLDFK